MKRFKLISDIEHPDGSKVYGIELGRYETREEAKTAQRHYDDMDVNSNVHYNFEIIDLEPMLDEEEMQELEFNKLINQLAKMRWTFEVTKMDMLSEDDILVQNIPTMKQYLGQDIRVIIFISGNIENILYEFDVNGVINAREDLENWN